LIPQSSQELDNDLKIILWGGIENYEFFNDLRKRAYGEASNPGDLTLPEWSRLMELVRMALEHPRDFCQVPLFLKELAFECIAKGASYNLAQQLVRENPYVSGFALRLSDYLTRACGLPADLQESFQKIIFNVFPQKESSITPRD
jgi:hypothetical protein